MIDEEGTTRQKQLMVQQSVESFTKAFNMARAREGAITLATMELSQPHMATPTPNEVIGPLPTNPAQATSLYPTSDAKQGVEMGAIPAAYQPVPTQEQPDNYSTNSYQEQQQQFQQRQPQHQGPTIHPYIQAQLCISIALCHSYLDNDAHKRAYVTRSCEIDGECMMARAAKESHDVPSYFINVHVESTNTNVNHVSASAKARATATAGIGPEYY